MLWSGLYWSLPIRQVVVYQTGQLLAKTQDFAILHSMTETYWKNFCFWATDYAAWLRMDKEFGGYENRLAVCEAKALLELFHYHWALDEFQ